MLRAAGWAYGWYGRAPAAPMATKLAAVIGVREGMIGHGNAALRALDRLAARATGQKIVIAASVQKEDRLVACGVRFYELLTE